MFASPHYISLAWIYAILCLATIIHYTHVLELLLYLFLQLPLLHIMILHKMTSTFSRTQHMKLCWMTVITGFYASAQNMKMCLLRNQCHCTSRVNSTLLPWIIIYVTSLLRINIIPLDLELLNKRTINIEKLQILMPIAALHAYVHPN